MDVVLKAGIVLWQLIQEVISRLIDFEAIEPHVEHLVDDKLLAELFLGLILIRQEFVDELQNVVRLLEQVLLELHALSDHIAAHGFLTELLLSFNGLVFLLALVNLGQVLTACTDGFHEFWLQKVVETVQGEALVKQLEVDFLGEAHQADGLVLHLSDKSLVLLILRGDQLSDEVLSICLSDGL